MALPVATLLSTVLPIDLPPIIKAYSDILVILFFVFVDFCFAFCNIAA